MGQRLDSPRAELEAAYQQYHRAEFLFTDPVQFPRRYADPRDREVAAFFAAGCAWGNVRAINAALERILGALGDRPAEVLRLEDRAQLTRRFRNLWHRRIHGADLAYLGALLGHAHRTHGTLGELWRQVDNPAEPTVLPAIPRFLKALMCDAVPAPVNRGRTRTGVALKRGVGLAPFGLAQGGRNSPFKRMNMLLRWLVREDDGVDLGLWREVGTARLVVPLDVHVLRQSQRLGLTMRHQADARTALEITAALRILCAEDPCRYDFALVRVGMQR